MAVDYRELLKKYMAIVGEAEGVDFLSHAEEKVGPYRLSDEEIVVLEAISAEVTEDYKKKL